MTTVEEVNKAFADKGMHIKLPLDDNFLVKGVNVLEKVHSPGNIKVLLQVKFVDAQGKEQSDLFHCAGRMERERGVQAKAPDPLKSTFLPVREEATFADENEAEAYLREAISHLLQDNGYSLGEQKDCDLYFENEGKGYLVNVEARCDDKASEKAERLIELRRLHGTAHDYALVVPAFQETLGVPLRLQERWIARHQQRLSVHHIGVYGVDNMDPNRIYSFTIYPRARGLMKYFARITPQWSLVRSRYVQERTKKTGQN